MNDFVKTTSPLTMPSPVPEKATLLAVLELAEEGGELNQSLEEAFALQLTTRHCLACNYEPAQSDVFCLSCGEFLDIEETPQIRMLYCCECGATVTPDDIFCLSCGAVLD